MNLAVFLTRGYDLSFWKKNGTLKRELGYYKILQKKNYKITFVSYGTKKTDYDFIKNTNFEILNRPVWAPLLLYSFILPFIHYKHLKKVDVIKTNQIFGTLETYFCCILFGKPMYSRSGYIPSSKISYLSLSIFSKILIYIEEFIACKYSKAISVSSKHSIDHLSNRYNIPKKKFVLLYNFVDSVFFYKKIYKKKNKKRKLDICFVGRLVESKQPLLLLSIIKDFKNINLHVLGDGKLKKTLKKESLRIKNKVIYYKKIDNLKMPMFFSDKDVLLFPTLEEGNSKVILESLACGLIVMTNDIDCNKELINHKVNGYLIKNNNLKIYKKHLKEIIKNEKKKFLLSRNAYLFANKRFNFNKFLDIELLQFKKCIQI